jgi:predicted dehydrogenase
MRLCFLGCGRVADLHSRTLKALGPAVRCSYASRDAAKASAMNRKHSGAGAFPGYAMALASPDVDAVAVVTPPSSHLEWTLCALKAGKDVILEKPPLLESADFDAVEGACRETGRLVFVAENYHYKPLLSKVREVLASGAIGQPLFVHLNAVKKQRTANWRDDPGLAGGGALFEGGIHWVNFANSLGFDVRAVRAATPRSSSPVERSIAVLFDYSDGPAGVLSYSWETASPLKGIRISRIYGTKGSIAFESNGLFLATSGVKWRVHFPGLNDIQGYKGMWRDFLDAWRRRTEPRMTMAKARRDLELIEEAYRSAGVNR